MNENVKSAIKIVIALALIAVSGYLSVRDIDLYKLKNVLLSANYLWVALAIVPQLAAHWLRANRWRTLLEPALKVDHISNWRLFKAVMVGYAANSVTPRGGELLRPYYFAKDSGNSFSSSFGTIIVERFLDLLTLGALFAFALVIFHDKIITSLQGVLQVLETNLGVTVNPSNFVFIGGIIVVIIVMSFFKPVVDFFLRVLIKPFSEKLYDKIYALFIKFRKGFEIVKSPSKYFRIGVESILIWVCYGLPMYLIFFAFDFQSRLHLGPGDAFYLLIVAGVAVTIAPTPGAIGVHHVAIRYIMTALYASRGLQDNEALAYAIVTNGLAFVLHTLVGGFFYVQKRKDIPSDIPEIEEKAEKTI